MHSLFQFYTPRRLYISLALLIALLGLGLRLYIAHTIPEDYDEDNYLGAARTFRQVTDDGKWDQIPQVTNNKEHPPLVKILYSLTIDEHEIKDISEGPFQRGSKLKIPPNSLHRARYQSALEGGLTILIVGLSNPLAAIFLGVSSLHVRFSSLAYLDALPTLFTALSVFFYSLSLGGGKRRYFWFSAVCFGIGVAAKYPFGIVGVVLVMHALLNRHFAFKYLIAWGLLAILVFYLFNPYIWTSPFSRTWQQLRFHEEYAEDQVGGRSLTQPIQQLTTHGNAMPHEIGVSSTLWRSIDLLTFGLAVAGVLLLLRQKSVYGWWLVIGMVFLMLWPTQWIQHKMMIMVPYSISAATALEWVWRQLLAANHRLKSPSKEFIEVGS